MTIEIPKVGRAATVQDKGLKYSVKLVDDYPVPTVTGADLLLKMTHTGLCLSDHHYMAEDWGAPMLCNCAGHEGIGVVAALGPDADAEKWKIGDRAGVKPIYVTCGSCELCRTGMEAHCPKAKTSGQMVDGTFCEYIVSPSRYTTKIPDGIDGSLAALTMCSGSTVYAALKATRARPGNFVVIPGAGGGVGHQGLLYGKAMGFRMIAIDTGADKEKMCKAIGAEAFVDFKTCSDIPAEIKRITGTGAHAVVVTGGTASAYASAPGLLRVGGVQVCVGLPTAGTAVAGGDPLLIILMKLSIVGSAVATLTEVDEALDFCARGLINAQVTTLPFKDFNKGWDMLVNSKVAGRVVIEY